MNKILLALNAGLALGLIVLIGICSSYIGDRDHLEGTALRLGAGKIKLKEVGEDDTRFLLDFPVAMVKESEVGETAALETVVLEPAVPVQCIWQSCSRLQIHPDKRLRPATLYTFHLDPRLSALDGRSLPKAIRLTHATRGLAVVSTVVSHLKPLAPPAFVMTFTLPVEPEALQKAVTVTGRKGARIPVQVTGLEQNGKPAFRITLTKGEVGKDGLPTPRWVKLRLDPGLKPRDGHLPLGKTFARRISFVEDLHVRGVRSTKRGIAIDFNREVCLPEKGNVEITPATPFQVSTTWRGIHLIGDFPPGESLAVLLKKGFPGRGRIRLPKTCRRSLRIRDRDPLLRFVQKGRVLSSRAIPELQVEGVNIRGYEVMVRSLYPNNVVRLMQERPRPPSTVFGPSRVKTVKVDVARNQVFRRSLHLESLLGSSARGFHLIEIQKCLHPDDRSRWWWRTRPLSRLIQVTDLGVTVRAAQSTVAVHVASLAAGTAVEGAAVRILTPTNQDLVAGVTDARGVVCLEYQTPAEDRIPFLVEVKKGKDATYVDLDGFKVELASDALGGRPYLEGGHEAFVAFDRGAIRPGGEVRATVVVRDPRGAAPAALRLQARWIGPNQKVWRTGALETSGAGLGVARLRTGAGSATGCWTLEVHDPVRDRTLGKGSFLVEAFVPDRMEARVDLEHPLRMGEEGRIRVKGSWLEGGPAAGRAVRIHVRYDPGRFKPEGFEDFHFGRLLQVNPPGARPAIRTVLDEKGEVRVRFQVPEIADTQVLTARIAVQVMDPSGRPVRASLEAPVLRKDFLVGVKAGSDRMARVVTVTPEGKVYPRPVSMKVSLERRYWYWKRVSRGDGTFRYQCSVRSERIWAGEVETEGGQAAIRLGKSGADLETRYGWLSVVVQSASARVDLDLGTVPLRPDRLRVTGPTAPVAPGSEAEILLDAPFGGTAFVTLEGMSLHGTHVAKVEPGRTPVRIRVPEGLTLPNLHAVVTLKAGQAVAGRQGPCWVVGGTAIALSHPERTTRVQLEAPPHVRPESRMKVRVQAPGAVEAVVALVDEGILNLTRHTDPDPMAFFLARRRLDSTGADTGTALLENVKFRPDALTGGGGGERLLGPRLRNTTSRFIRTVALFRGPFDLDENGVGEAVFTLPPYEGRLRAMVIAAGPEVVGAGSIKTVVKAPLGVRVATPRMLAPGDQTFLPVTVRNNSGKADRVRLTLDSIGGLVVADAAGPLRVEGGNIQPTFTTLHLRDGETRTLRIRVRAGHEVGAQGRVQGLRVLARMGPETRTVEQRFPVRPAACFDVDRRGLTLEGSTKVRVPGTWIPGTVKVRLVAGGSPDLQMGPALEALVRYPYGCVEQTTSRCMALLACRSLFKRLHSGKAATVDFLLQEGIDHIFSMQTHNGGFSMWPGGRWEYAFGTVYALDFLLQAKAAGVAVPRARLKQGVNRLYSRLTESKDVSLRAYAAEVVSRAGRPVASWLRLFSERSHRLEDRARLALAYSHLGRDRTARALLMGKDLKRCSSRETGGLLRTPLREKAVELRARLAAAPGDGKIPELVADLTRAVLRPGRLNTQEQGQALLALARYHDAHATRDRTVPAVVAVAGKRHRLDPGKPLVFPLEDGCTEIEVLCEGRLYGLMEVSGFRIDSTGARIPDLTLARSILDADTGKPVKTFRQGGVYEVVLKGNAGRTLENLLVTDVVPGGFEIENPRLGAATPRRFLRRQPDHLEIRDDRVLLFASRPVRGKFTYAYRVRAVFPGVFRQHPFVAETLYEAGVRTRDGGGGRVKIEM